MRASITAFATTTALVSALYLVPSQTPARDPVLSGLLQSAAVCTPREGLARRDNLGALLAGAAAWAAPEAGAAPPPPLMPGLGDAHLSISTTNKLAQAYFDQGLNMLHGFNHAEAARAFRHAQDLDPTCAMCFWGEAFALGPNINAPMAEADNAAAYAAAHKALTLMDGASPVEQALIEAMAVRYSRDWPAERAPFDAAFANAMAKVADRFPENDLVQVLAAEADMDTQPWDYWQPGGREPKGRIAGAIKRVETVLARNPTNAGASHLYIHLVEASTDPWKAEQAAAKLDKTAPNAGHLVHMPAHIYYRVGRFKDSMKLNIEAAEVDARYIATANASPMYQYGYYTHNLHFVAASAQLGGDGRTALEYADKLDDALPMAMAAQVPIAQPVKAAVWFARADFADPKSVLAAPAPDKGVDYVTAAWRYARAMAHLRAGRIGESRAEAAEIAALAKTGDFSTLVNSGVPAPQLMDIYLKVLEGRALMAENKPAEAIALLEAASIEQAKMPYMEPPYVYFPTGRTLGAAYLMAGRHGAAERTFMQVLVDNPNDALAYWGIAEARKGRGDKAGAKAARALFEQAWLGRGKDVKLSSL
jgi:tetratricopeptide (TPR) repeat protein